MGRKRKIIRNDGVGCVEILSDTRAIERELI